MYVCNYLLEHGNGIFREAITMQNRQLFLPKFKWYGAAIANWPNFLHRLKSPTLPWCSSAKLLKEDEVRAHLFAKGIIIYNPKSYLKHKQ